MLSVGSPSGSLPVTVAVLVTTPLAFGAVPVMKISSLSPAASTPPTRVTVLLATVHPGVRRRHVGDAGRDDVLHDVAGAVAGTLVGDGDRPLHECRRVRPTRCCSCVIDRSAGRPAHEVPSLPLEAGPVEVAISGRSASASNHR